MAAADHASLTTPRAGRLVLGVLGVLVLLGNPRDQVALLGGMLPGLFGLSAQALRLTRRQVLRNPLQRCRDLFLGSRQGTGHVDRQPTEPQRFLHYALSALPFG